MAASIRLRRGNRSQLPPEAPEGEVLLTLDTSELFFGEGPGNGLRRLGGFQRTFDLTSQIDGSRRVFNLGQSYVAESAKPFLNGLRLMPSAYTETNPEAGVITLVVAPTYNADPELSDALLIDCVTQL